MGLMRTSLKDWAHFIQADIQSVLGGLPGSFTASQSAADYD
jgi:hypothetical protein